MHATASSPAHPRARRPGDHRRASSRRARGCSTSAAATAPCSSGWRTRSRSTGAASRSRQKGVNEAVARGLSVIQGDADHDLATYPDDAFDFVILSQTLQATHNPRLVLEQLLRIGRKVDRLLPELRQLADPLRNSCCAAGCRSPRTCPIPGTTRPTSTSARSATSWPGGGDRRAGREGGGALRRGPRAQPPRPPRAVEPDRRSGDLPAFTPVGGSVGWSFSPSSGRSALPPFPVHLNLPIAPPLGRSAGRRPG